MSVRLRVPSTCRKNACRLRTSHKVFVRQQHAHVPAECWPTSPVQWAIVYRGDDGRDDWCRDESRCRLERPRIRVATSAATHVPTPFTTETTPASPPPAHPLAARSHPAPVRTRRQVAAKSIPTVARGAAGRRARATARARVERERIAIPVVEVCCFPGVRLDEDGGFNPLVDQLWPFVDRARLCKVGQELQHVWIVVSERRPDHRGVICTCPSRHDTMAYSEMT